MSNASESTMLHIRAATMVIINGKTHRRKGQRAKWDRPRESKPCWRDFTVPLSSMHSPGAMKPLGGGGTLLTYTKVSPWHSQCMESSSCPARRGSGVRFCHMHVKLFREMCWFCAATTADGCLWWRRQSTTFFFFFFILFFIRKKEKVVRKASALTLKHVKTKPKGCQKFSNITQECEWALVF